MRVTQWFSGAGLVLLALVVLFSTLFSDWLLKGARIDLTDGGLYTLSDGSKNIVQDLDQPLDVYFFFSQSATRDALGLRNYAKQVRELLEEFERASNGRIHLTVIDPEPFSEQEDRAAAFGLEAVPLNNGSDPVYFGLVAQYGELVEGAKPDDNKRSTLEIPFFQPDRQQYLEYDIAKLIHRVSQQTKPTIGMLSGLEVDGGFDMMTRQATQPWFSVGQIRQLFDVQTVDAQTQDIRRDDYDMLLVIHPKSLPETTLFAIDQYVLNGGHALFFVDPYAELEKMGSSKTSDDLNRLFNAWGINFDNTHFIGDAQLALQVGGQGVQPVRHLGILQLSDANLSRDDMTVNQLETLHMSSAGYLTTLEGATTTIESLIRSSEYAQPLLADQLESMADPRSLMVGFQPTGERYTLAAKITGKVKSAFPQGAPVAEGESSDESTHDDSGEYRLESDGPINVVIVADTDVLTDRLWVQVQQFMGQSVAQPFADNGNFVFNTVDMLSGSADLINIRGRGRYFRPFTVVKDMQREAETRFQSVEQTLTHQLQSIEEKLANLQQQQGDDSGVITLTPEVQSQLENFQQEKLSIRKKLRDVQHQLNKEIERLDFTLKLINIALVPVLITVLALGITMMRRRRLKIEKM